MKDEREKIIERVNEKMRELLGSFDVDIQQLYNDAQIDRGKKNRALLCMACAGGETNLAYTVAACVELIHVATLIHDDIIDGSVNRRSQKALHAVHGLASSVLCGDLFFVTAICAIERCERSSLVQTFLHSIHTVLLGEIKEQCSRERGRITRDEYLSIVSKKSGSLFAGACKMGLMLQTEDEARLDTIYQFGMNVGIAYQILDDCCDYLNAYGEKRAFDDVRNGLYTLPVIFAFESLEKSQQDRIAHLFSHDVLSNKDAKECLDILIKTDCFNRSLGLATKYLESALNGLNNDKYVDAKTVRFVIDSIKEKITFYEKEHSSLRSRLCGTERG